MKLFDGVPGFSATSAGGWPNGTSTLKISLLIGAFGLVSASPATSSGTSIQVPQEMRAARQTSAGVPVQTSDLNVAGEAIAELRRLTGLTWEQLARLLDVSRRSLHFWASGQTLSPANEERLQRLVSYVRKVDRGSAAANRAALLSPADDGQLPFDLLAAGDYEGALWMMGNSDTKSRAPQRKKEWSGRPEPASPASLVGALQDRPHREAGVSRGLTRSGLRGVK
jgi:DNA-binding transcriptional regulator YiaG